MSWTQEKFAELDLGDKWLKLWTTVTSGTPVGRIAFTHAPRRGQRPRRVQQTVWAQSVTLAQGVTATCVIAREEHQLAGVKSVEWRLLSNRAASDIASAAQLLQWYCATWPDAGIRLCEMCAIGWPDAGR